MVNGVRDLSEGDEIYVAEQCPDELRGHVLHVSDITIENVGITETFGVSLVTQSDDTPNYSIVGTTADSQVTICEMGGGEEHSAFWKQIEVRE